MRHKSTVDINYDYVKNFDTDQEVMTNQEVCTPVDVTLSPHLDEVIKPHFDVKVLKDLPYEFEIKEELISHQRIYVCANTQRIPVYLRVVNPTLSTKLILYDKTLGRVSLHRHVRRKKLRFSGDDLSSNMAWT